MRARATATALASLCALATPGLPARAAADLATPAPHRHVQAPVSGGPAGPALLPTGQYIDALATPGASYQELVTGLRPDGTANAAGAMTTALSPDGTTLLVLTSGFNAYFLTPTGEPIRLAYPDPTTGQPSSTMTSAFNWVFVYDVAGGIAPQKRQAIQLPDTFAGIAWDPSGTTFYVSGGQDDRVYVYRKAGDAFVPAPPFIVLGHDSDAHAPRPKYDGGIGAQTLAGKAAAGKAHGLDFGAEAAGVAVSADGTTLYVANLENDSVSFVDLAHETVRDTALFSPGRGPTGEYPFWVTAHASAGGATDKLYVSSIRDGEVDVVTTSGASTIVPLGGEPGKMLLTHDGSRLYVANPDLDEVDEILTATDSLVRRISVQRPGYRYRGAMPNALALSADDTTLYATLGGENAVAVIDIASGTVRGRIPTPWYPTSVTLSPDGTKLYITNTKSNAGPNPAAARTTAAGMASDTTFVNQYDLALEKGGLLTVPIPDAATLTYLTALVDANDNFARPGTDATMAFLHTKIHHVIFIQKENRTYDQVLGDLGRGNGDPSLTVFGGAITPNFHRLATQFADLDNFYTSSDVSGDGWNWTEQGHANDYTAKFIPLNYSSGAFTFDANGTVRSLNPASPVTDTNDPFDRPRLTTLLDPTLQSTILPGAKDPSADEGADDDRPGVTGGYIWDSVLRAGLTVRHYGEYDDTTWYRQGTSGYIPVVRDAAAKHVVQGFPLKLALRGRTDPYFRGWDLNEPDEYRYEEWKREFDGYVRRGDFPNFEPLVLMMDHTGQFATQVAHLNTPELEVSSNDHAVGQLVDAVSHSKYWASTAIFVIEDDSQNGPDHVDAHRSPGFVISPWVRHGAVVHTNYNTTSMLRTIEDLLGVEPLGEQDANAEPMSDLFTTTPDLRPYDVIVPGDLCDAPVDAALVPACADPGVPKSAPYRPLHAGAWWQRQSDAYHLVWDGPDKNDADLYNRLLWTGIRGTRYPVAAVPAARSAARDPDDDDR